MATRVNYNTIYAKYKRLGKGNVRLTQSTLVLSKPINPNVTTYNFDVLETQTANLANDEIRLNLNDEFIITQLGLYLEAEFGSVNTTGVFVPNGVKKLFTYSPMQLNAVEGQKVQNFFAGQFQISVNNIVYLDKFDTRKMEFVPRTQLDNFQAVAYGSLQDSVNFSKDSMYSIEPLLTLSGAKKNQLQLSLPTAISQATFSWTDDTGVNNAFQINRVLCLLRGLNAQNGSVFQGTNS